MKNKQTFGERLASRAYDEQRRREKEAIRRNEERHEHSVAIRKMKEQGLWK